MKIAYTAVWPIPSRAANSVHVMKMCQALVRCNHEVTLFCPQSIEETNNVFEQYGVDESFRFSPIKIGMGRLGLILYAIKAAQEARKFQADLFYSRCLMSSWMAALFGLPTLFEKHSSFDEQGFFAKYVFKSLVKNKNFKGLVVISEALKEHLQDRFDLLSNKIIVAHDGADPMPDVPDTPPFNKKEGAVHIGYIGHLYKGRGIDIIAAMAKKLPDMRFHIVGGTNEDIAYWKKELATCQNITFYGHIPHAQTTSYLRHFDILLAPYQTKVGGYGGIGNTVQWMSPLKVFEYMSTGIPTICSDLPVLHEVLENRKNVFLCRPNDPEHWIETVEYIGNNDEVAQRISHAAQVEFLSKYTWGKRAEYISKYIK